MVNYPSKSTLYIKPERLQNFKKLSIFTAEGQHCSPAKLTKLITADLSHIKKLKIILIFKWLLGSPSGSERNQPML